MKLVIDTNCIIDLEEHRKDYDDLMKILSKWKDGSIDLGVVAISASENQKGGYVSKTFKDFENKLSNAGLQGVEILSPMLYWGVGYWDHALWVDESMKALENKIHEVLFPGTPIESPVGDERTIMKWRNNKCDVQLVWALIHHKWEILVTNDGNFHRKAKQLLPLGVKNVLSPCEAAKRVAP